MPNGPLELPRCLFEIDAVLFDLDGVLTSTASIHETAWKTTFDSVLHELAGSNTAWRPFNERDYQLYVDGKPRLDGVRSFLQSRNIHLSEGGPDDSSASLTIAGIGARKNESFQRLLSAGGATTLPGAVDLVHRLRANGKRTAVVSASRNCSAILAATGLTELFDAQVDGIVAAREGLRGKPYPDTFLAAAHVLAVDPSRAAVIEDAIAGVEAGRAGGFSLVIGVDRRGGTIDLRAYGAHLVVHELTELLGEVSP